jgi:hypothetical protein
LKFSGFGLTSERGLREVFMVSARKFITAGVAALTIATSLAAVTPAQAWYRGGWGGGWGYRGGYYGGGWGYPRYGYGAGLAGAAIGGAVVGAAIANSNRCYQHYPRYDAWGNFIGYTTGVGPC